MSDSAVLVQAVDGAAGCAFCGAPPLLFGAEGDASWLICCSHPAHRDMAFLFRPTRSEAIAAWNRDQAKA